MNPARFDHATEHIRLVETHISWVILTGPYAYKIKKPVNLGFLDFSTLEQRHHYCEEELRLNRRLAPQLYLDLIRITGTADAPVLNGTGAIIEYAVKMTEFPQEAQLDRVLARGGLEPGHIDALAQELAEFHGRIDTAGDDSPFGSPARVHQPVQENFEQIHLRIASEDQPQLHRLQTWSEREFTRLENDFVERKRQGFIRECHGDAHLANMALLDEQVVLFDCLEFNDNLRWIDVMNETAFVIMDLDDRGRPDFARRCLNAYLEHTGDYPGIGVFRFYQVYRALVRAKVACIRMRQEGLSTVEQQRVYRDYRSYADLAERYTSAAAPALIITHGLSGCGKTWMTQSLLEAFDAIRIRSDIERKRLHGLATGVRSRSEIEGGLYTTEASQRTYARLTELAQSLLHAGHSVIVDAAFLKRAQRGRLRDMARAQHVPFVILDIQAPLPLLRDRVIQREQAQRDASEANLAVLERQCQTEEPLSPQEQAHVVAVSGEHPPPPAELAAELERRIRP